MRVNDFEISLCYNSKKICLLIESCIRVHVQNPMLQVSDEYYGWFYGCIHRLEPYDDDYLILIDECGCYVYIPSSNITDIDFIDEGDEDEFE